MHLRISTKRQGDNVYKYAQIVESYRRDDGVPAHKVIASLGRLSDQEITNLRVALQASRKDIALVMPGDPVQQEWPARIIASLSYLDVAVALTAWNRWHLPRLINRLLPKKNEAIPPGTIIAALALHRCTDPGSKLYAQRWFPTTALPELLDLEPKQFGNTRIHRTLDALDRVGDRLQTELVKRYRSKDGLFATIFMDVTDAWFTGRGPDMAERNRTKEGFSNKRKIGIVLVCNEHGYPIRWKVVPGKRRDNICMEDMLDEIQGTDWIGQTPLVCDRAMGRAKSVARLYDSGVRFLTATTRPEIDSYTQAIPHEPFLELHPVGSEATLAAEMEVAGKTAEAAGLTKLDDLHYVLDLGVCQRALSFERPPHRHTGAVWDPDQLEGAASFIALARIFADRLKMNQYRNKADLAEKEGMTRARVTQIMNTIKIAPVLQEQILRGEFGYVPERLLRQCVKLSTEQEQRKLLQENARVMRPVQLAGRPPRRVGRQAVDLRLVAYFNPRMFVEHRGYLYKRRQQIEQYVRDLNEKLTRSDYPRDKHHVRLEVHKQIARWKLISVFDVTVTNRKNPETGNKQMQVRLKLNHDAWTRRLRYTGFVLLVGHPELPHTASEIVDLYREKDTVEKDFRTIKSAVKLRPLFHHTDGKVRAHVTLCMLALLLERTIEKRLGNSKLARSAASCFEQLRTCRLNLISSPDQIIPTYAATEPTHDQLAILRNLRMTGLIDPEEISESIKFRRS